MSLSEVENRVINVSQSKASVGGGSRSPTITPGGTFWLGGRGRLLRGCEAMRLQGLHLPRRLERRFPSTLLHDMAGNSFSTVAFQAIFICAMASLSRMWDCAWKAIWHQIPTVTSKHGIDNSYFETRRDSRTTHTLKI